MNRKFNSDLFSFFATLGPNLESNFAWILQVLTCKLGHTVALFCRCRLSFDGRRPLREDDLWWKTTFVGRWTLVEDDFWWKTTFDGRRPLMKKTFDWRRPLMKDDLWWETTFDGRQPLMEDDLWWKTTFDGRHLWWKTSSIHILAYHRRMEFPHLEEVVGYNSNIQVPALLFTPDQRT